MKINIHSEISLLHALGSINHYTFLQSYATVSDHKRRIIRHALREGSINY